MESLLCQEHVTISEPCHLPVGHHFLPWVNGKNDVIGLLKKWICQCLTWDMYSIKNTCIIKELTLRLCYWAVPCYFNFEAEYWYTNPKIITVSTCLCYIACVTLLGEVRTRNRGGGWDCLWHIHCLIRSLISSELPWSVTLQTWPFSKCLCLPGNNICQWD